MNYTDVLIRLKKTIAYLKGEQLISNQQDIVNKMGYNKGSVSQALNNKNNYLTEDFVKEFAKAFKLNYTWLLTGEGEMLNKKENSIALEPASEYKPKQKEGAEFDNLSFEGKLKEIYGAILASKNDAKENKEFIRREKRLNLENFAALQEQLFQFEEELKELKSKNKLG